LENDGINVMVLGGVWCPHDTTREINERIRDIKIRNSISPTAEMKWTKISPSKLQLYIDLVNYFFDEKLMHFRAVVVPDKNQLDHERFNQTHDDWYYKMYFEMLKQILMPKDRYEIYIDVKDTNSSRKAQKLREVCSNSMYDFSKTIIRKIQPIQSKEVQLMQVVDILIGALGYANRQFADEHVKSSAKLAIIDLIKKRSGYSLSKTTLLREEKFNILIWDAR
jgi:hypothetical protein